MLFLDELPEFPRGVLETLRQPLEDRRVTISRLGRRICYPADFLLVAAQNPCPCGFYGDPIKECTCAPAQLHNYHRRTSGPLLDRIDMHIQVPRIAQKDILQQQKTQSSDIHAQIATARTHQQKRIGSYVRTNAHLTRQEILASARLETKAKQFLDQAADSMQLSARAYLKTIRVARTIADLEDSQSIRVTDVSEALQYRQH